jgi:hypothetical protein
MKKVIILACLLLGLSFLTSCASFMKQKSLERVAKDWCQVIRASQVIPVYPLTEDLQPGDVFLVTTSIHDQAEEYKRRGYLPLDMFVKRFSDLKPEFQRIYGDGYWEGTYAATPHPRPEPESGATTFRFKTALAPMAAFPSYTFNIRTGSGIRLAIPVQGVPVGLGFLKADKVNGSIDIQDAYTYAVSGETLVGKIRNWVRDDPDVQAELSIVAKAHPTTQLFLRAVSRVYLTGRVRVTLRDASSTTAQADVGAAKKFDLANLDSEKAKELDEIAKSYAKALSTLNSVLNEGLPGGSLKIAAVSSRSITLDEYFERLLAIGYLGFDMPIHRDGTLGPAVATRKLLYHPEAVPQVKAGVTGKAVREVRAHLALVKEKALKTSQAKLVEISLFIDEMLKKPAELDRFRNLPKETKIDQKYQALGAGMLKYLGTGSENSSRYNKIMTVLDKALNKLEGGS